MRFLLLCAFLISLSPLPAPSQVLDTLGHQSWGTANGLPQDSVHQIFQTRDGYIWAATEGGVARFDGVNFRVFNRESDPNIFSSDDVNCLAQPYGGPPSTVLVGTADGLIEISPGDSRRYSMVDGLPSTVITAVAASDDGSILVLTPRGLARLDPVTRHFTSLALPMNGTVFAMSQSPDGTIWFNTNAGLFQYQRGHFNRGPVLSLPIGRQSLQGDLATESVKVQLDHTIWIRTHSSVIRQQTGNSHQWTTGSDLPGTRIQSFLVDSHNILWIGTNKSLVPFDSITGRPLSSPLTTVDGSSILSLLEDREGNIWVGTENTGMHIFRRQKFRTLPDLASIVVNAIVQTSGGTVFIGTNGDGLYSYQNGSLKHLTTNDGLVSDIILSLAADPNGALWIGTPDGLNHLGPSHIETTTSAEGLPDDFIRSLLVDTDGSLWIGTRRGLAHRKDGHVTVLTHADGLGSDLIGSLIQSADNSIWIGTLNGLSHLSDGHIVNFTTSNGLSGNTITALLEDPGGTLWIGTHNNGLSQRTGTGFIALHRNDIPSEVNSLLQDRSGFLWLSSSRGVTRIPSSELIACGASPQCRVHATSWGPSDGMPTEEMSANGHPAAWRALDGRLWFATHKGVAIVDPAHLELNQMPPPVMIERFSVDDKNFEAVNGISIPPYHSHYAFEYAGLSFTMPSRVRYRTQLEGFDKQWSEPDSRRIATYTNLPPGHYVFRVRAANNDGVWNDVGASIAFIVNPPFYRTWWFYLLLVAFLGGFAILIYRLRVRHLQSRFDAVLAERNRMAREIHDTLAQSFVGVSLQLELTSQLLSQSQNEAANRQLDRTKTYVREGIEEARRSIWELRAASAQDTLPARVTKLVDQLSSPVIDIRHKVSGTYRALPDKIENEILRIVQEALVNARRHSDATCANLLIRYETNSLHLEVADNGRGFDPSRPATGGSHYGLKGMRERATLIGAVLDITSIANEGTTVTLYVPLSNEKGPRNNA